MTYYPAFPNGMRFRAYVTDTWYPPINMVGAVGCDVGEEVIIYDDDADMDYEDPNGDGWALIRKCENNQLGYFPEAYMDIKAAIPMSKWTNQTNPARPNGGHPSKTTNSHPDGGKPGKPPKKASGGMCCSGGTTHGKAGKKRALELAEDNDEWDDGDDDDVTDWEAPDTTPAPIREKEE